MTIFIIAVFEILLSLIVIGVNYYTDYQVSMIFYQWLGFTHIPGVWPRFLIEGALYLVGILVISLLLRVEFIIGKLDEEHPLYLLVTGLYKVFGNFHEVWPLYYLIPLTVLQGLLIIVLRRAEYSINLWWLVTYFLIGLWAIHLDKRSFKQKKVSKEKDASNEEYIVSEVAPEGEAGKSFFDALKSEYWFHNQVIFRLPWPATLTSTSPYEYKNIVERLSKIEGNNASDEFNQKIAEDPVLTGLSRNLIPSQMGGEAAKFFKHQETVFNKFARRWDENRKPIHILITTPIGSGRTLVSIMAAIHSVLRFHKNVLFVFKDPSYGRILADKVKMGLANSNWDWSVSLVEYWSDEDFPKSNVHGRELKDFTNPDILITDVDTIHQRILPKHADWYRYLSGMGLIVAEGLEKYGGIQGANSSQVFIRLRRILQHYKADPQIIGTSTNFNGLETFFERLFNIDSKMFEQEQIIGKDGRQKKAKEVIVWNTAVAHHRRGEFDKKPPLSQDALDQNIRQILSKSIRVGRYPVLISKTFKICGSDVKDISKDIYKELSRFREGVGGDDVNVLVGDNIEIITSESGEVRISSPLDVDTVVIAGVPGSWTQLMHELDHLGEHLNTDPAIVLLLPHTPLYQYLGRDFPMFIRESELHPPQIPINNVYIRNAQIKAALEELPATEMEILEWFGKNGLDAARRLLKTGELVIKEQFQFDLNNVGRYVQKLVASAPFAEERTSIKYIGTEVWRLMIDDSLAGMISEDQILLKIYPQAVITLGRQRFFITKIDDKEKVVFAHRTEMEEPISTERIIRINKEEIEFEVQTENEKRCRRKNFYEGAQEILLQRPMWVTIEETIIGYTRYKSFSYYNAGSSVTYQPPEKRPPLLTRGYAIGFPNASEKVLHTISHLIRSAMPLFLCEEFLDMEIVTLDSCEIVDNQPAILIYDSLRGGTGVADWFIEEENLDKVLWTCLDMLISCSCSDGCRGCVVIHNCNQEIECRNYDKSATIEYLGRILNRDMSELVEQRKEHVESHIIAEKIRDKIVEYVFPHKLGLEIKEIADLLISEDLPEAIGGLYVSRGNIILIRPYPEERMIMVLAHEYAHNWQSCGTEKMHSSLRDPQLPFNGKLFIEGFAQWIEYKVADFFGLHWFKDEIKFQNYNEYLEGFRILNWIEYEYNRETGLGAGKVIEFIKTGKLVVDGEEINLETMIRRSGVAASLKDSICRFEKDPPVEDEVEEMEEA